MKGTKSPMVGEVLRVISANTIFLASVGTAFALGACTTAKLRNKDDHWNAVVGGMAAGSLFGLRARRLPLGLGMASFLGLCCGAVKLRFGTYLPQLPAPVRLPKFPPTPNLSDSDSKSH